MDRIHTIGRRKTSIARIYLSQGNGNFEINGKTLEDFFPAPISQATVRKPFEMSNNVGKYDLKVNVRGGGVSGQAEAIQMAVARALITTDPELRTVLKPEGMLTRDPRMVERKKFGKKKARKSFQFSKR
jgi:small subunit ribosomal protein S9